YFSGRNKPATIVLEGDNFIGFGSVILGNVTIGKGAIVAACSFVNKDVPPNSVVGGVPAKVLRNRY
ncbi:TPA: transferase, partial [Klebsiella pneumoniae]|nr:transferase [Klebsiella pneumoniae]